MLLTPPKNSDRLNQKKNWYKTLPMNQSLLCIFMDSINMTLQYNYATRSPFHPMLSKLHLAAIKPSSNP